MANPKLREENISTEVNKATGRKQKVEDLINSYTSDLVAPPTMNTKTRLPSFLKSLDACLRTESLQEGIQSAQINQTWCLHWVNNLWVNPWNHISSGNKDNDCICLKRNLQQINKVKREMENLIIWITWPERVRKLDKEGISNWKKKPKDYLSIMEKRRSLKITLNTHHQNCEVGPMLVSVLISLNEQLKLD